MMDLRRHVVIQKDVGVLSLTSTRQRRGNTVFVGEMTTLDSWRLLGVGVSPRLVLWRVREYLGCRIPGAEVQYLYFGRFASLASDEFLGVA